MRRAARRGARPAALAALGFALPLLAGAGEVPPSAERVSWLAGCWERRSAKRVVQEQWTGPLGGTLLGVTRTVTGGRTVAWEYLRIEESEGGLVLVALPSGQAEARFTQTLLGEGEVVFSNPGHDFPQEVGYRLLEDGSLLAHIAGDRGGERRVIEFPYARASCDAPNPAPDRSRDGG